MKIYFLEPLMRQIRKKEIAKQAWQQLYRWCQYLAQQEEGGVQEYLRCRHGIKVRGCSSQVQVMKFEVGSGERVLFCYGKDVPFLAAEEPSLVFLCYSGHDEQIRWAEQHCWQEVRSYTALASIAATSAVLPDTELLPTATEQDVLERLVRGQTAAYVFNNDELALFSPGEIERHKLLSSEQGAVVETYDGRNPLFIAGGAGTGKTLVLLHLLKRLAENNSAGKIGYFAQSRELLSQVKWQWADWVGEDSCFEKVEFWDLNAFCLKKLGRERKLLLGTEQFLLLFERLSLFKKLRRQFGAAEVWQEIRGVLKGRPAEELWGNFGLCRQSGAGNLLAWQDYARLKEEQTIFAGADRRLLYAGAEAFNHYLQQQNRWDENDLARECWTCREPWQKSFAYILVDEVQDYTPWQIFLLGHLVRQPGGIIFAGDIHQMVNPTVFTLETLEKLFYTGQDCSLATVYLRDNFRCTASIINVANRVAELRRQLVGHKKQATELGERSARAGFGVPPFRLKYTMENLHSLLMALGEYPQAAVLVRDEATKKYLAEEVIGKDFAGENKVDFIFTVAEVKGMEYEYVLCYNLLQNFDKDLQGVAKRDTKSRYPFNLLYVAVTRAREYLCFMDEELALREWDREFQLAYLENFLAVAGYLQTLEKGSEAWREQGDLYRRQGKYKEALQHYRKAQLPERADEVLSCHLGLCLEREDYGGAACYALLLGNYAEAEEYARWAESELGQEILTLMARLQSGSLNLSGLGALALKIFGGNIHYQTKMLEQVVEHSERVIRDFLQDKGSGAGNGTRKIDFV